LNINHIKILLEKYKFYNNKEDITGNKITFIIVRNEAESLNSLKFNKERKINIFVCFDHDYYLREVSFNLVDKEEFIPKDNLYDKNFENAIRYNNEFIKAIIVRDLKKNL